MAFMEPDYIKARAWRIETKYDGVFPCFEEAPFTEFDDTNINDHDRETACQWFANYFAIPVDDIMSIERDDKPQWYCRLSAPGYMDCTDWNGPFDTEDEARDHICDTYDVDPDTGDDLEDPPAGGYRDTFQPKE